MAQFNYVAMDGKGREQKGKINAASPEAAAAELKGRGLFPTSVQAVVEKKVKHKRGSALNISLGPAVIKRKQLTVFTRQLAILLSAGLPLIRSLRTLEKQSRQVNVKTVIGRTADTVETGSTFAEALSQNPKSFDKLYLNMVRAGEASGAMEVILDRLASFMEKSAKIAGKVKSAMIYPIVILSIALLALVAMMIFIVPKFEKIFSDLLGPKVELPDVTKFIIGISKTLVSDWYIYLGTIVGIIVAFKVFGSLPFGRKILDTVFYKMPLFGPIVSKTAISRFSRTLGTLLSSGVPILNALAIVKETSGNELVGSAIQKVTDHVKEGEGVAKPLGDTGIFPDMVVSMVEVGEETGKLPEMLDKIADTYEEEVDNAVGALTSLIEPLMIVFLAGVVGTIVVALFSPLVKIIETLS